MNLAPLLDVVLTLAISASAPADLPVKTPEGWTSKVEQGIRVLTPKDLPEGKTFSVLVPPIVPGVSTVKDGVDAGVKMVAEIGEFKPLTEAAKGKTDGGWDYEFVLGTIQKDDLQIMGQVVGLKKGDEGGILIVIADGIETLQKYTDPLAQLIRGVGVTERTEPPAAASRVVDLRYTAPAGWEVKRSSNSVLFEKQSSKDDEFYGGRKLFRLLVLPTQALDGDLRKSYLKLWAEQIAPNFQTTIAPMPLMVRLKSGMACAVDGDHNAKNKEGVTVTCTLYVIARGGRVTPIVGVFVGWTEELEKDVVGFLQSASIPGGNSAATPLFSSAKLSGDWTTSSVSLASYVTVTGAYAGDASIMTGESYSFRPDGTFSSFFGATRSSGSLTQKLRGKWSLEDATLILKSDRKDNYTVYGYGSDPKVGDFLVLSPYPNEPAKFEFTTPRRAMTLMWLKRK